MAKRKRNMLAAHGRPASPTSEKSTTSSRPPSPSTPPTASPEKTIVASNNSTPSGQEETDMAPAGPRRPPPPKRELDLSVLLNMDQKNHLISLVTASSDSIQKELARLFDSQALVDPDGLKRKLWNFYHPDDKPKPSANKPDSQAAVLPAQPGKQARANPRQRKIVEKDEELPRRTTLAEQRKDSLAHFGKWQGALLKRMDDITVRGQARAGAGPGSGARFSNVKQSASRSANAQSEAALLQRYPPIATPLRSLSLEKRKLIMHAMLLLILSLEHYAPYSRILLLHMAASLGVPQHVMAADETRVARGLSQAIKAAPAEEPVKKRIEDKNFRRPKGGSAGPANTMSTNTAARLAAPLLAAGIGTIPGGMSLGTIPTVSLVGSVAQNGTAINGLFGIYATRSTGKIIDTFNKDMPEFALLPLNGPEKSEYRDAKEVTPEDRRLRVVIAVGGTAVDEDGLRRPWGVLGTSSEAFVLRWELDTLSKVCTALDTAVLSTSWNVAKQEFVPRSAFACLIDRSWPDGLLKISKILDNSWLVGMVRSEKAGAILADALINKVQGERGVSLVGFGLGAKIIYQCLMILSEKRAFGLVDSAVLMGAPVTSDGRVWCAMKSIVGGRLINVYSENDYLLGFLYRTAAVDFGLAGLQDIEGVDGMENLDVSHLIYEHGRYQHLVGTVLKTVGWEDINLTQIAREEETAKLFNPKENTLERMAPQKGPSDIIHPDRVESRKENIARGSNESGELSGRLQKLKIGN